MKSLFIILRIDTMSFVRLLIEENNLKWNNWLRFLWEFERIRLKSYFTNQFHSNTNSSSNSNRFHRIIILRRFSIEWFILNETHYWMKYLFQIVIFHVTGNDLINWSFFFFDQIFQLNKIFVRINKDLCDCSSLYHLQEFCLQ